MRDKFLGPLYVMHSDEYITITIVLLIRLSARSPPIRTSNIPLINSLKIILHVDITNHQFIPCEYQRQASNLHRTKQYRVDRRKDGKTIKAIRYRPTLLDAR
jgi:hypothetical protein